MNAVRGKVRGESSKDWRGLEWASVFLGLNVNENCIHRGEAADLIIVLFFIMRDLDGSRSERFPYKGLLRGVKERFDVGHPHFLGMKHPFRVLSGKILDDCGKRFRTNLVPEHTQIAVGL